MGRRFGLECAFIPLRKHSPDGLRTAAGLCPSSLASSRGRLRAVGQVQFAGNFGEQYACRLLPVWHSGTGNLPRRMWGGILAQETCQDECGVATGREEPLTSGGTGHHNLLIPYPSHSPTICSETLPRHGQSAPSTLSFFGGNRRRARNLPRGKGLRDEKEFSAISVGGGAKKVAPARHNCN